MRGAIYRGTTVFSFFVVVATLTWDLGSLARTCEAQARTVGVDITCGPTEAPAHPVRVQAAYSGHL